MLGILQASVAENVPGDSEFTAMPYWPSSRDSARVKARIAPFDVT
jgi:hypothetical protein